MPKPATPRGNGSIGDPPEEQVIEYGRVAGGAVIRLTFDDVDAHFLGRSGG